jgi:hypothetical protein
MSADEEMLRHNKKISYRKFFQVIIQKKEIRIVVGGQAFTLGSKGPVKNLIPEDAFLAL